MSYENINEKNVKYLFNAVYRTALNDYVRTKDRYLKNWLIGEGREIFAPFLSKREVIQYLENL